MYQLAIDSRRVHILQNVSHTIFDLSLRNEFSRRSTNPWFNLIGQTGQNMTFEFRILVIFAFSFKFFPRNGYFIVTWQKLGKRLVKRKSGKISTERFITFDRWVKMTGMLTVCFEGKRVGLSTDGLNLSELERIYQLAIDSPGVHLKIKSGAGFQNIWPDRAGKFDVPPNCFSAIAVAMPQPQENEQAKNCPLKRFVQKMFFGDNG